MHDAREFWREVHALFDPEEPARERRVTRPYSPVPSIIAALDRPFGEKRFLVLGTVGSGKSTELYRIMSERESDDIVVLVDLYQHFAEGVGDLSALDRVQPWEVLFLIGLAVYRVAKDQLGHHWSATDRQQLESAAAQFVSGPNGNPMSIDVAKLAKGIAVASVIPATLLLGPVAGTVTAAGASVLDAGSWELPFGLPGRKAPQDQEERVRALLGAVNLLIGKVQTHYRPVTLLVDGLDRIAREETTRELFVASTLLGSLASQATIMTGSVTLRRAGLAGRVRRFDTKVLANAPVLDAQDPTLDGSGVAFLRQVYAERVADLPLGATAFPEALLSRVARFSGGRVREFVRMVRMVAERMWDMDAAVATMEAVDQAIDERRRLTEMGIHEGHIEVLKGVTAHKTLPDSPLVPELLDRFWLLPYPNASEWYYPHPLLTMKQV